MEVFTSCALLIVGILLMALILASFKLPVVSSMVSASMSFTSETIKYGTFLTKLLVRLDEGRLPRGLPPMRASDVVTPRVTRVLGMNPGMHTLQGTNTYLVGTGKKRILIDAGEGKEAYMPLLTSVMEQVGCESIEAVLLTHHHFDHVGGVNDVRKRFGKGIPVYKKVDPKRQEDFSFQDISEGQMFTTEGATLRAVLTPGHTADHVSFVLLEEKGFFCGDMILGCGTAVFEDYRTYMGSLRLALALCTGPGRAEEAEVKLADLKLDSGLVGGAVKRLYTGHGPHLDDAAGTVRMYLAHRLGREKQILNLVKGQQSKGKGTGLTSMQITMRLYGKLPMPVLVSAHNNVLHHLRSLQADGEIEPAFLPFAWRVKADSGTAKEKTS